MTYTGKNELHELFSAYAFILLCIAKVFMKVRWNSSLRPMGPMRLAVIVSTCLLYNPIIALGAEPPHKMIDTGYHHCPKDNALRGGIWGKGPFKSLGPNPSACAIDEWRLVNRKSFKALAVMHYQVDWSKEIHFWSHDNAGTIEQRRESNRP